MGDKWQKAKVSKFVVGENGLEIKVSTARSPSAVAESSSQSTATANPAVAADTRSWRTVRSSMNRRKTSDRASRHSTCRRCRRSSPSNLRYRRQRQRCFAPSA